MHWHFKFKNLKKIIFAYHLTSEHFEETFCLFIIPISFVT